VAGRLTDRQFGFRRGLALRVPVGAVGAGLQQQFGWLLGRGMERPPKVVKFRNL
jgi:hypothetical protein